MRSISQHGPLSYHCVAIFFIGYLKSTVYNDRPSTLIHLKNNIDLAIINVPIDMLERVDQNLRVRLTQCIQKNGRHLIDIIFKTCKK